MKVQNLSCFDQKQSQRGFTLIELMITLVIIGILATLAVPNFSKLQEKSRETSVLGLVRSVQVAVESYALVTGTFPNGSDVSLQSFLTDLNENDTFMTLPKNPFTGTVYTDSDPSGQITYSFDSNTGEYTIVGFGVGNTLELISLTNG